MMNDREEYWTRVQAALDARRDPLEDEAVQRWLLEHPHDVDELAQLRASLHRVERVPSPRSRRRVAVLTVAAAGITVVLLAWSLRSGGEGPARDAIAQQATTPPVSVFKIHTMRFELRTTRGDTRTTTTWEDGVTETTTETRSPHHPLLVTTATRRGRP